MSSSVSKAIVGRWDVGGEDEGLMRRERVVHSVLSMFSDPLNSIRQVPAPVARRALRIEIAELRPKVK
jgi:hypothetical protein